MKCLIADDEQLILRDIKRTAAKVLGENTEFFEACNSDEVFSLIQKYDIPIVFLDIEIPFISGLEIAARLQKLKPRTNIIFVTGNEQYALNALSMYVSGFLMKPVSEAAMRKAVENLRDPIPKLMVKCFGHFEVLYDGKPVDFKRSMCKEVFAYLIDKRGAFVSEDEIRYLLWSEEEDTDKNFAKASITKKTVKVSGIEAADKVYDGTLNAALNQDSLILEGKEDGDELSVSAQGGFETKDAGEHKKVVITGVKLSGKDAGNYKLSTEFTQAEAYANITKCPVTVSGITAKSKVYDGSKNAELNLTSAVLSGKAAYDSLSVTASGQFDTENAGTSKLVTISGLTLTGADQANYELAQTGQQTSCNASITKKPVVVSGIKAQNKGYDGNTDAGFTYTDVVISDIAGTAIDEEQLSVTAKGSFSDKNIGTGKTVSITELTLTGAAAGNYVLADSGQQTECKADIEGVLVTVSGITAKNKMYDGTTDVSLELKDGVTLSGIASSDRVSVHATAEFEDAKAGTGKKVRILSIQLTGRDAANYQLAEEGQLTECMADINPVSVVISGITAKDKVYDGTDEAQLVYDEMVIDGKLGSDAVSASAVGTFSDPLPGEGKTVSINSIELTGRDAANYVLAGEGQQMVAFADIVAADSNVDETIAVTISDLGGVTGADDTISFAADRLCLMALVYTDDDIKTQIAREKELAAEKLEKERMEKALKEMDGLLAGAVARIGANASLDAKGKKEAKNAVEGAAAEAIRELNTKGSASWETVKQNFAKAEEKAVSDGVDATNQRIIKSITPEVIKENSLAINKGLKVDQKGKKLTVSWGKVDDADGYEVYVQYIGKKFTKTVAATTNADVTKATVKKIGKKKLNLKKKYKVYVSAYRMVGGKKVKLAKSITGFVAGRKSSAYTNAKTIKLQTGKLTVKKGAKTSIRAKTVLADSSRKLIPGKYAKEFRYASTDEKVATVDKKGNIKGVAKGKCSIYVYAQNGFEKEIFVTVK